MMFFRSVSAVFRGVSSYPEFSRRNPFRGLLHLLLFCLLLSLICSGLQLYFIGKKLDPGMKGITEHFGSIKVTEEGILPSKGQERSWSFSLPGNFRLDYITPEGNSFIFKEMDSWEQPMGFFWVRCGFLCWIHPDPSRDVYYVGNLPIPDMKQAMRMMPSPQVMLQPVSRVEVQKIVERYQQKPVGKKGHFTDGTYQFSEISAMVMKYTYAALVIQGWLGNFVLTLILILMFSAMQSLWRAPGLDQLKFGGTVSLLSYAAYPAVTAQMVLESFSFHLLAEILFFILFFIYQLMAFNEVRRAASGPRPPEAGR